jgi:hypothetical protein
MAQRAVRCPVHWCGLVMMYHMVLATMTLPTRALLAQARAVGSHQVAMAAESSL